MHFVQKGKIENSTCVAQIATYFLTESHRLEDLVPKATFAPIDILDHIHAVLHCPCYRENYKEFPKIVKALAQSLLGSSG